MVWCPVTVSLPSTSLETVKWLTPLSIFTQTHSDSAALGIVPLPLMSQIFVLASTSLDTTWWTSITTLLKPSQAWTVSSWLRCQWMPLKKQYNFLKGRRQCMKLLCALSVADTRFSSSTPGWNMEPPPNNSKQEPVLTFVLRLTSEGSVSLSALSPCFTSSSKLPAKARSRLSENTPTSTPLI